MTKDRTEPAETPEGDAKGTLSFSVRLTDKQRELLARAAEIRGWSMTNLLKNAALEKAVHIINTTSPNRIDFKGIASQIASQAFEKRGCRMLDHQGALIDVWACSDLASEPAESFMDGEPVVEVSPWHTPPSFLAELKDAARYGGAEFLNLIVESSEGLVTRSEPNLPDPIDPSTV